MKRLEYKYREDVEKVKETFLKHYSDPQNIDIQLFKGGQDSNGTLSDFSVYITMNDDNDTDIMVALSSNIGCTQIPTSFFVQILSLTLNEKSLSKKRKHNLFRDRGYFYNNITFNNSLLRSDVWLYFDNEIETIPSSIIETKDNEKNREFVLQLINKYFPEDGITTFMWVLNDLRGSNITKQTRNNLINFFIELYLDYFYPKLIKLTVDNDHLIVDNVEYQYKYRESKQLYYKQFESKIFE